MTVELQPPSDPCPDCGYEGCVCDRPTRFPDDQVVNDPFDDELWSDVHGG